MLQSSEAGIGDVQVNVMAAVCLVHRHLSGAMCELVFRRLRTKERARKWTLEQLARFWVAVVMYAPKSLREAIEEYTGPQSGLGLVESSPSSLFERAQTLRWAFFRELFDRFIESLLRECPQRFETKLRARLRHFPEVWIVDGSGLDRIAKRLKVLRGVEEVVIPGSVIACYDLFRGVLRQLHYYEKLLGGEAGRLREILDGIPEGTLLVGDRGYSSVRLLAAMAERRLHGLVRLKRNIVAISVKELGRRIEGGCEVIDRLATIGTAQKKAPATRVRLIEKRLPGGEILRLATTVLDPKNLSASAALALYRRRWSVERLFSDLKSVLNLRRIYASNTNAVAMQVYTCAIVYDAMRVAQGEIAEAHDLEPEEISTAKLFPRLCPAHMKLLGAIECLDRVHELNPGVDLVDPDFAKSRMAMVRLKHLLVGRRKGRRNRPGYSKARTRMVPLSRYETHRARPDRRGR
jgi:hypothetical protein